MTNALLWLRRDLRLADHPALQATLFAGHVPIPVYIHDEPRTGWPLGQASAWWLHHSLAALQHALRDLGSDLLILRGTTLERLLDLAEHADAAQVYWGHDFDPRDHQEDAALEAALAARGIAAEHFNSSLLCEPDAALKRDGTPYRVFTPFWKALQQAGPPRAPQPAPDRLPAVPAGVVKMGVALEELDLLPAVSWDRAFYDHWTPGEDGAHAALEQFCTDALPDYAVDRDRPDLPGTSRLSPHLHFGELSPQQVWHAIQQYTATHTDAGLIEAGEAYVRQLGWREFGRHLLYHFPHTANDALDRRFAGFPWKPDYPEELTRWQRGQTGIPIVDAGMRELWTSGWMHNRVRMVVASLLTKNLMIPWQEGARWFWNTLVDADLANNTLGWQWTAGCGADAAPYFRIFNPVRQGERFDPDGSYVRRWVPELHALSAKWIHQPWAAPAAVLEDAGIRLGESYPEPIVDLAQSRRDALSAWDEVKHIRT
jgi:deoxyribodipyrimidine photo-lyase